MSDTQPDRSDIRFSFPAEEILAACEAKVAHHAERLEFWHKGLALAEEQLTQSAEPRDEPISGGTRRVIVFDQQIQNRVNECRSKADAHRGQLDHYRAWIVGLHKRQGDSILLSHGDVLHFGLDAALA